MTKYRRERLQHLHSASEPRKTWAEVFDDILIIAIIILLIVFLFQSNEVAQWLNLQFFKGNVK